MPICTITGLHWKQPECPHDVHWPHPSLAMGSAYVIPAELPAIPYRTYILMVGACLSELVRCERAILSSAISKDGKRFPEYCSLGWLTANIAALQDTTAFICQLTPKQAAYYPSLSIDPHLRLDSWLEEVAEVKAGLAHESLEFAQARQAKRDSMALQFAGREALLLQRITDKAISADQELVKAAYIERVCAEARDSQHAIDYTIHISELSLERAVAVMQAPEKRHTERLLKEVRLFVEIFAPHETLGDYAQYRLLMAHIDKALTNMGSLARLADTMPIIIPKVDKVKSDNAVLAKLQERLQAMINR